MKKRIGTWAFSMLLAVLLVSVMVVPAVAQDEKDYENTKLDIVDTASLQERPPSLIQDLRSKGCSEEEIAEVIVNLPRVSYLPGWTEEDDKRISPLLQQGRGGINYSYNKVTTASCAQDSTDPMFSSGMWLFDEVFKGVNGRVYPGPMECSSDGTKYQYLTTHLGKEIDNAPNWIEVGIATFNWEPGQYYVFTYDNNDIGNEWITHSEFTDGNRDYNFEIFISDVKEQEGYPYTIF